MRANGAPRAGFVRRADGDCVRVRVRPYSIRDAYPRAQGGLSPSVYGVSRGGRPELGCPKAASLPDGDAPAS